MILVDIYTNQWLRISIFDLCKDYSHRSNSNCQRSAWTYLCTVILQNRGTILNSIIQLNISWQTSFINPNHNSDLKTNTA